MYQSKNLLCGKELDKLIGCILYEKHGPIISRKLRNLISKTHLNLSLTIKERACSTKADDHQSIIDMVMLFWLYLACLSVTNIFLPPLRGRGESVTNNFLHIYLSNHSSHLLETWYDTSSKGHTCCLQNSGLPVIYFLFSNLRWRSLLSEWKLTDFLCIFLFTESPAIFLFILLDEAAIAEEMKDFINEDEEEEEAEDENDEDEETGGEKRKHESEEEDDQLEDEDYELIEENLGIKVKRVLWFHIVFFQKRS